MSNTLPSSGLIEYDQEFIQDGVDQVRANRLDYVDHLKLDKQQLAARELAAKAGMEIILRALAEDPSDVEALLAYAKTVDLLKNMSDAKERVVTAEAVLAAVIAYSNDPVEALDGFLSASCGWSRYLISEGETEIAVEATLGAVDALENPAKGAEIMMAPIAVRLYHAEALSANGQEQEGYDYALEWTARYATSWSERVITLAIKAGRIEDAIQMIEDEVQLFLGTVKPAKNHMRNDNLDIYRIIRSAYEVLETAPNPAIMSKIIDALVVAADNFDGEEQTKNSFRAAINNQVLCEPGSEQLIGKSVQLFGESESILYWHAAMLETLKSEPDKDRLNYLLELARQKAPTNAYAPLYTALIEPGTDQEKIDRLIAANATLPQELKDDEWVNDCIKDLQNK